jgi:hypothetical protein
MGLRTEIRRLLRKINLIVARNSSADEIGALVKRLKPQTTNIPLIRIGGKNDGGYLVPDDLQGISACFSPGVSNIAEFEFNLAERGIKCFLADFSVDRAPLEHENFYFTKKFLGSVENDIFTTLSEWTKNSAPDQGDLLLQMDIEGAEYNVFHEASGDLLKRFRIIVAEFHSFDMVFEKNGLRLIEATFDKILKDFEVVHIHPNNSRKPSRFKGYEVPPLLEFTFLRRDRISSCSPTKNFSHPLDAPNLPKKSDVSLPQCWHK